MDFHQIVSYSHLKVGHWLFVFTTRRHSLCLIILDPIYYSTIQRRVHLRDVEKFIQEWGATDVEKREEYLKRQEDLIKDIRQV